MHGKGYHPKDCEEVRRKFVASGIADVSDKFDFIAGRLIGKTDPTKVVPGTTLRTPDVNRWAIYFNDPMLVAGTEWILRVFGINVNPDGQTTTSAQIDGDKKIKIKEDIYAVPDIGWPVDTTQTYCSMNFCPYGTYTPSTSPPDTIVASLNGGGVMPAVTSSYLDTSSNFWSLQFANFTPPASTTFTLTVTVPAGQTSTRYPLTFNGC
jgi:hypothetical protein